MARHAACLLLVLIALVPGPVSARDWFVDNVQGSDRHSGRSPTPGDGLVGPFRTIQRALAHVGPGDRVTLAANAEPYRECVSLSLGRHSGIPGLPVILDGAGAVLDGTQPIPVEHWESVAGDVVRVRTYQGNPSRLFLAGKPLLEQPLAPGRRLPELDPLSWCQLDGYLYFRVESGRLIGDYPLSRSVLPVGVTLYEVHDVAVLDLTVQGFNVDGVQVADGCHDVTLLGLQARNNARSGLAFTGSARAHVVEAVVLGNGRSQLWIDDEARVRVEHSRLDETLAPLFLRSGGRLTVDGALLAPLPAAR